MIDNLDATSDALHLAIARAFRNYSLSDLISLLIDRDPITRTAAARELHTRGGSEAFGAAQSLASKERFEFREIAAFLLGQLGTPSCPFAEETFPILSSLLEDPYFEVRAAAIGAFGSLASLGNPTPPAILNKISILANSFDREVRIAVAATLGFDESSSTGKLLNALLDDDDESVREIAKFSIELREARKNPDA